MTVILARQAGLVSPDGHRMLAGIDWEVRPRERWVVVGANGSGKTSLLRLAAATTRPTTGTVDILGARLGRTDMRALRAAIGVVSTAVSDALRPGLGAHDAVMSARFADLEPWWHAYEAADHARADRLLESMGCAGLAEQMLGSLSAGERQRVMLARAMMPEPRLLLLDEPAANLDLPAREALVELLATIAADEDGPPMVLVTHHLEEIPPGMTHALVLAEGRVVASGPIGATLTGEVLSGAFGLRVTVHHRDGRWAAWASNG